MEDDLPFATKLAERYGLKKAVVYLLVLGVTLSIITYSFPPIFEAIGDVVAYEIRHVHARLTQ